MDNQNPYAPPTITEAPTLDNKRLEGLGGWLILVAIILILNTLAFIVLTIMLIVPLLDKKIWNLFNNPLSQHYVVGFTEFMIVKISFYILLMLGWCVTTIFFFRKKRAFKKLFISLLLLSPLLILIDAELTAYIFPNMSASDISQVNNSSSITWTVILIWYISVSERVANTFVN